MKAKALCIIAAATMIATAAAAQDVKRPDSYNYTRGVEAVQGGNVEEAMEYLGKELQDNPKNGYASIWMAVAYNNQGELGRALSMVSHAVENIPKKDKEYVALAFMGRGNLYGSLGKTDEALADYTSAIRANPESIDAYEKRGDLYYSMGKLELAEADYRKMIEIDPGSVNGYVGLGLTAELEGRHTDAIGCYDYAIKLDPGLSFAHSARANAYIALGEYEKASDDIITALAIDGDDTAFYLMQVVADTSMVTMATKLKVKAAAEPNNGYWPYCLGVIYEHSRMYAEAIANYQSSMDKDPSPITAYRLAVSNNELCRYADALKHIGRAMELDSTDGRYILEKADILYNCGDAAQAIDAAGDYIAANPEESSGYYVRGFYKKYSRDVDGAISDFTTAVVLSPDEATNYIQRGTMYEQKGDTAAARADYRKAIFLDSIAALDSTYSQSTTIYRAYLGLGMADKAAGLMDSMLAAAPDDNSILYNAASLYAQTGDTRKALEYLRKALEKGFRMFTLINYDYSLDAIRKLPEFLQLMSEYKAKLGDSGKPAEAEASTGKSPAKEFTVEIPFTKEPGSNLCMVKCHVNGLPLHFVFDTGASSVSLSQVEASFMVKNGYLSKKDVVGNQYFLDAAGNVNVGTEINLRKVDFGGLTLSNVRASVVSNQKAPLLLGQSVLNRLGKIEIDNGAQLMKVTYEK